MTTTASTRSDTATTWQIDPERTSVSFTIRKRHFHVLPLAIHGRFSEVASRIRLDAATPAASRVETVIQAASVASGNGMRDKHLRGSHFFAVEQFPAITFVSSAVTAIDPEAGRYRIAGELTIRDVTRSVELDTEFAPDQEPRLPRLQFSATTRLNRHDFGLHFSPWLMRIGDDVANTLEVEAVRR